MAVSGHAGDIEPTGFQGLFHRDLRVLSRLALRWHGQPLRLLTGDRTGASGAAWVCVLAADAYGSPTAVLVRSRELGPGLREHLRVHSYGQALAGTIEVAVESDFADLLELKGGGEGGPAQPYAVDGAGLRATGDGVEVRLVATGEGVQTTADGVRWSFEVGAGGTAACTVEVAPSSVRDEPAPGFAPLAEPPDTLELRSGAVRWTRSVASALDDLRGLRVEVPSMGLRYLGAGAPWYMALFGRDTLLTAWESLITGTARSLEVLQALARRQGSRADGRTGEQPGRILHELRTGFAGVFGVEPGLAYYGTVDATPLFVMLLGEVARWGAPDAEVRALLPAARAAAAWCAGDGDVDGDGFVEYVPDPQGLANQGWKDSGDALVHADGTLAGGPIALAEVQGYTYAAYLAMAELEERLGEATRAAELRGRADALRSRFVESFWLPRDGNVALALDGDKRPLTVATSNIGHVLWSGILPPGPARAAAARLVRPDLAATWGLRTLSSAERAYNPLGYHLGSVWPHDTAIGIAGLARYGFVEDASRLVDGLLRAAEAFGWRLPELLAGIDGADVAQPVPYPVACSPQAWSAAAPLLLLRSLLRLDPDVPAGVVHVAPAFPEGEELEIRGIALGSGSLDLRVRGREVEVLAAPAGLEVRG